MRTPMPSPRGTNHAGLFVTTNPRAAYDAAPDDDKTDLILFLMERLNEADFKEACRIGKLDEGITMDSPEPFAGMQPGGGKFGQDARYRRPMTSAQETDLARRFPHAAKITVNP